jgi:tetratricopeptide (TPR) repeat protein
MKLNEKAYSFAQKILKLNEKSLNTETKTNEVTTNTKSSEKDEKRIVGGTDYKKYEDMANEIEVEDIKTNPKNSEVLKMGCNNDLRKERQLFEKPSKDKIEAAKIFKNEGDDCLKAKNYSDAINAYEKGLLQLFYTFSNDGEEDKQVDAIKASINMNISMCKMNLNKFEDAIQNCLEALRVDKNNMKAIYRIAHCYFKLEKLDDAKKYTQNGLDIQADSQEFKGLLDSINKKEKDNEDQARKFFKKIVK